MNKTDTTNRRKGNGRKGRERGKGTGTLEKRGRVYIARWTVDGKRFSQSTGTGDRAEAEKALASFVAPFRLGGDVERLEHFAAKIESAKAKRKTLEDTRPALALADAWDAFVKSPARPDTCNAASLDAAGATFAHFVGFMRKNYPDVVELRQVTREHASAYVSSISHLSASTYNVNVSKIARVWRVLADDETARLAEPFPFARIAPRHVVKVSRRELTTDELRRVCGPLTGEDRTLFAIGIYTGLRLGDCSCLTWGAVDLRRGFISVIPMKTARYAHGKPVTIPLLPDLAAILAETPPEKRTGDIMPGNAAAYRKCRTNYSWRINRHFERAGIERQAEAPKGQHAHCLVGFHSLRHTFVSIAANAGIPLAIVQRIVGHSTAEMTNRYYHENVEAMKKAVQAFPSVLGTATPQALADASTGRLDAFRRMVDEMTPGEREEARRYLERFTLT